MLIEIIIINLHRYDSESISYNNIIIIESNKIII